MLKKCDTCVIHYKKKNHIWGHIPYLYLRKNIFYCRIEKHRINNRHKIEHNKFAIFDGNKVSTGSFNWTNLASEKNSENCLLISREQKTVAAYKKRFEKLWRLNDRAKSESWFDRKERQ